MIKVSVRNLGKIESADIELAPLVVLVGKNNTGKSYLATTLWALSELDEFGNCEYNSRRPAWLKTFIRPDSASARKGVVIDNEVAKTIKNAFSRELSRSSPEFLKKIFNNENFHNSKINITSDEFTEFTVRIERDRQPSIDNEIEYHAYALFKSGFRVSLMWMSKVFFEDTPDFVLDYLYYEIVGCVYFGQNWATYDRSNYIPAARTGIMLALPALVSSSLYPKNDGERIPLPAPMMSFVRRMSWGIGRFDVDSYPIVKQIRDHLLSGDLEKGSSRYEYKFKPKGTDLDLPLHATSSMITEVAPFLAAVAAMPFDHHLIFEEPEAHLHLEAQREMARVIARLVSSGTRVTLTTHSDTFLQQLNNLMVLHNHQDRDDLMERFGYEEIDLINPADIRAYEFCPSDDRTQVKEISRTDDGFVVSTLNETLLSLAKETLTLRYGSND